MQLNLKKKRARTFDESRTDMSDAFVFVIER